MEDEQKARKRRKRRTHTPAVRRAMLERHRRRKAARKQERARRHLDLVARLPRVRKASPFRSGGVCPRVQASRISEEECLVRANRKRDNYLERLKRRNKPAPKALAKR